MIPEPDVLQCCGIALDVRACQASPARNLALFNAVQREGFSCRIDVVLNVRKLADLFIRFDDEALEQRAVDSAANRYREIQPNGNGDRPAPAGERLHEP